MQPGELWDFDSDSELLEICRNTIAYHNTWTYPNSIPKVYTHAARMGYDPETLIAHIKALTNDPNPNSANNKMKKNYHIYDGQHGVEKVGLLEALNNLLCQSDHGIIKVFPAWPAERGGKFTNIREKGAFLLSSERAAGKAPSYVEVTSEKGQTLELVNPWNGAPVLVQTQGGEPITPVYGCTRHSGEYTIRFDTASGMTYRIEPANTESAVAGPAALTLDGSTIAGNNIPAGQMIASPPLLQPASAGSVFLAIAQYDAAGMQQIVTATGTAETEMLQCALDIVPELGGVIKVFVFDLEQLKPLYAAREFEIS